MTNVVSDKWTQKGEQEVCEEQLGRESERENQGELKEVVRQRSEVTERWYDKTGYWAEEAYDLVAESLVDSV